MKVTFQLSPENRNRAYENIKVFFSENRELQKHEMFFCVGTI